MVCTFWALLLDTFQCANLALRFLYNRLAHSSALANFKRNESSHIQSNIDQTFVKGKKGCVILLYKTRSYYIKPDFNCKSVAWFIEPYFPKQEKGFWAISMLEKYLWFEQTYHKDTLACSTLPLPLQDCLEMGVCHANKTQTTITCTIQCHKKLTTP